MKASDGIAAIAHGPSEVDFDAAGTSVTIVSDTDYPFDESITMTVKFTRQGTCRPEPRH